jgi:hypothetical protein
MDWAAAINGRRLVAFDYQGHSRVVIPACYGLHATTGNPILRAYQVRGTSSSRNAPLWDLFLLVEVMGAAPLGETFSDDPPGYRRNDKHISPIYAQL